MESLWTSELSLGASGAAHADPHVLSYIPPPLADWHRQRFECGANAVCAPDHVANGVFSVLGRLFEAVAAQKSAAYRGGEAAPPVGCAMPAATVMRCASSVPHELGERMADVDSQLAVLAKKPILAGRGSASVEENAALRQFYYDLLLQWLVVDSIFYARRYEPRRMLLVSTPGEKGGPISLGTDSSCAAASVDAPNGAWVGVVLEWKVMDGASRTLIRPGVRLSDPLLAERAVVAADDIINASPIVDFSVTLPLEVPEQHMAALQALRAMVNMRPWTSGLLYTTHAAPATRTYKLRSFRQDAEKAIVSATTQIPAGVTPRPNDFFVVNNPLIGWRARRSHDRAPRLATTTGKRMMAHQEGDAREQAGVGACTGPEQWIGPQWERAAGTSGGDAMDIE